MNGSTQQSLLGARPLTPDPLNLTHAAEVAFATSVSVVIPLFNCLELTRACVDSLQATLPPGVAHEIILVDDGSTDGTRDWLATRRAPPFRVLLNERNRGYAVSNNRGAALARGDLLLLLNNDLLLPSGWFEPLLAAHHALGARAGLVGNVQRDARTGAVDHAGIVINAQGKPVHARALPATLWGRRPHYREVPAVTGACVLLKRALWHELGGFDEGYMNGGEDIDLCFRARAAGRSNAVALRSVIRHHVSASPGRKRRDEENSYRLAARWRAEFLACTAADSARDWCRVYLGAALQEPRSAEFSLALRALGHLARLRRQPPPEAIAGVTENLAREFARWERMFGAGHRRS